MVTKRTQIKSEKAANELVQNYKSLTQINKKMSQLKALEIKEIRKLLSNVKKLLSNTKPPKKELEKIRKALILEYKSQILKINTLFK
tara:strand:+ start:280 stop:540 length:261 start_codon:yes stop_codon:yes gene_type:complete